MWHPKIAKKHIYAIKPPRAQLTVAFIERTKSVCHSPLTQ